MKLDPSSGKFSAQNRQKSSEMTLFDPKLTIFVTQNSNLDPKPTGSGVKITVILIKMTDI